MSYRGEGRGNREYEVAVTVLIGGSYVRGGKSRRVDAKVVYHSIEASFGGFCRIADCEAKHGVCIHHEFTSELTP